MGWWDSECDKIKRLRRAAFKKWQYTLKLQDLIQYKKIVATAKKTFKEKKKEYFRKFAETINSKVNAKYVWNICRILKNKWVKIQNHSTNENMQLASKVKDEINRISPPYVSSNPEWIPECPDNDFLAAAFNCTEFNLALESRNIKSSPGTDGIDYAIIKKLPTKFKLLLLDIFNEMYTSGNFPNEWKHHFVHFIPRPNSEKIRPISLSSCICKLLETMIKNRLDWWLEHEQIMKRSQTGFRKGTSCLNNLSNITMTISQALSRKEDTLAVFLDVKGAFDNVNCDILLKQLSDIGCPLHLVKFVKFITHERYLHTAESNEIRKVYKGVPQGGVLSPILYSIYVRKVTKNASKEVLVSEFADDVALYCSDKDVKNCILKMERVIRDVEKQFHSLGLEITPEKTNVLHFNNKKIKPGDIKLQIGNQEIKSTYSARFLGIMFDYKLSFRSHIEEIQKRTMKALNIIKFLRGTWWGCDPSTLLLLYKSYIRSIIEYGLGIYFPTTKKLASTLEKIQYEAIRISLGYRRSTPTNVITAESKLPTIRERAKFLLKNFYIKTLSNESLQFYEILNNFIRYNPIIKKRQNRLVFQCAREIGPFVDQVERKKNFNIYNYPFKQIITPILLDTTIGTSIKNVGHPEIIKDLINHNSQKVDAHCVGAACYCPQLEIKITKSINTHASIYTAECIALKEALNIALELPENDSYIFSDSLSALQTLSHPQLKIKVNTHLL